MEGVSETQDKPAAGNEPDAAEANQTSAQASPPDAPPYKPVIAAKAAKRANASVIGMVIALLVCVLAFLPHRFDEPGSQGRRFQAGC